MPRSVLRVGTRGSMLALAQAESVRKAISNVITHRNFELVPVGTQADTITDPTQPYKEKRWFVDDIQDALSTGKIDLAVHDARHLTGTSIPGIVIGAVPKREDPRDALLTRTGGGLNTLQPGTSIGTTSPGRAAQLVALGKGLVPTPIHGSLDVRLRAMTEGEIQALCLALAGLKRLGRADRVAEILPINVLLPAPGQGALAVECRANDNKMRAALAQIEDPDARAAFEAERSLAASFGDGNAPIGALAEASSGRIRLRGLVGSPDGKRIVTDQLEGDDPEKVGLELAERLRAQGADEILASL